MFRKFLVNKRYGGFSINKAIAEHYGVSPFDYDARYDENLIAEYERGTDISGTLAKIELVELPEGCTDYCINDYDGCEEVVYVVDGKLYWA